MASVSIFHWLIVIAYLVVIGVPVAKILSRVGYSRWWTIVAFVPLVNLIFFYLFAFARWPREI